MCVWEEHAECSPEPIIPRYLLRISARINWWVLCRTAQRNTNLLYLTPLPSLNAPLSPPLSLSHSCAVPVSVFISFIPFSSRFLALTVALPIAHPLYFCHSLSLFPPFIIPLSLSLTPLISFFLFFSPPFILSVYLSFSLFLSTSLSLSLSSSQPPPVLKLVRGALAQGG